MMTAVCCIGFCGSEMSSSPPVRGGLYGGRPIVNGLQGTTLPGLAGSLIVWQSG